MRFFTDNLTGDTWTRGGGRKCLGEGEERKGVMEGGGEVRDLGWGSAALSKGVCVQRPESIVLDGF